VSGPDVPDAVGSFDDLSSSPYSLPRYILKNVAAMGYQEPTPIQMQAIPLMLHVSHTSMFPILGYYSFYIVIVRNICSVCLCVREKGERERTTFYIFTLLGS
jgi:hypothetical protein